MDSPQARIFITNACYISSLLHISRFDHSNTTRRWQKQIKLLIMHYSVVNFYLISLILTHSYSPLPIVHKSGNQVSKRTRQQVLSRLALCHFQRTVFRLGFAGFTGVVLKSSIFWDITLYNPLRVNQRFGGTCCLLLQDWRVSKARNQHEAGSKFSEFQVPLNGLHGVISRKTELSITFVPR
jgi:hypothetical protein